MVHFNLKKLKQASSIQMLNFFEHWGLYFFIFWANVKQKTPLFVALLRSFDIT